MALIMLREKKNKINTTKTLNPTKKIPHVQKEGI